MNRAMTMVAVVVAIGGIVLSRRKKKDRGREMFALRRRNDRGVACVLETSDENLAQLVGLVQDLRIDRRRRVLKTALDLRQGFDEVTRQIDLGNVTAVDALDEPRRTGGARLDRHVDDENRSRGQYR